MVSESLTLTFNQLIGYYNRQLSSLRLSDVIFWEMECVRVKRFLHFSRRRQHMSTDLREKFFQGLGENTLSLQPTLKSSALGL